MKDFLLRGTNLLIVLIHFVTAGKTTVYERQAKWNLRRVHNSKGGTMIRGHGETRHNEVCMTPIVIGQWRSEAQVETPLHSGSKYYTLVIA